MAGTNNLQAGDKVVVDWWDGFDAAMLLEPWRNTVRVLVQSGRSYPVHVWTDMVRGLHLPLRKRHP